MIIAPLFQLLSPHLQESGLLTRYSTVCPLRSIETTASKHLTFLPSFGLPCVSAASLRLGSGSP